MGALFGEEVDIDDPEFGVTDDDQVIATQLGQTALDTPPGSLDEFLEYGFEFRGAILRAYTKTELALLPLELRTALEQEPAFVSAEVVVTGPPEAVRADCSVTVADGDAVGFAVTPS